ncbi:restriction endonuclease subunit S [[Kitasatospora] papulosa]|uniref:restriction endonuclease subunit S n=1 Tax=[Kitasatospora] papulosa TaxID=1464011 RepID=UPI003676B660
MTSTTQKLPYAASLPNSWEVVPLKHLATLNNGYIFKSENWADDGTPIIRIENLNGSEKFNYSKHPVDEKYWVHTEDLLFAWSGNPGTSFGPFRWHKPGLHFLNQHIFNVSVTGCDKNWMFWALKAATHWIERELTSGMIGMVHVTKEDLRNVPIPIPPREEQRRIAQFLDSEVGKIDDLLAKKRRLVMLLNERIDSRILHHVGASELVDPSSGEPAIPLRRLARKVSRAAVSDVGVITAYRDGQVTERSARRASGYTLTASAEPQGQHVVTGDVVVHGLDGFAGAIGTSEAEGNCSPVYHVCVPRDGQDANFLGRLLRLLALQGYLGNFATSTRERALDFRNWDLFGRIPVPVIPQSEQREIGKWIAQVKPLRAAIESSALLAAERRQALITAAVTGQFDVSTASGRNVTDGVSA